jgi:hypothetical protein
MVLKERKEKEKRKEKRKGKREEKRNGRTILRIITMTTGDAVMNGT